MHGPRPDRVLRRRCVRETRGCPGCGTGAGGVMCVLSRTRWRCDRPASSVVVRSSTRHDCHVVESGADVSILR
eukprot:5079738-Prymnesium_polylepis.1